MLDNFFGNVFGETSTTLNPGGFIFSIVVALLIGLLFIAVYMYRNTYTKTFVITLALLPAIVATIIMMVSGNIGAGIAVAGAFSLARFRSAPGSAKEIATIFLAMGAGLVIGMGYPGYAVIYALILSAVMLIYQRVNLGGRKKNDLERTLRITVPEDLEFDNMFDDLFESYTTECSPTRIRTTNMGSLYRLQYDITLRDTDSEKEFIDKLRCRNGNLEVCISQREEEGTNEL